MPTMLKQYGKMPTMAVDFIIKCIYIYNSWNTVIQNLVFLPWRNIKHPNTQGNLPVFPLLHRCKVCRCGDVQAPIFLGKSSGICQYLMKQLPAIRVIIELLWVIHNAYDFGVSTQLWLIYFLSECNFSCSVNWRFNSTGNKQWTHKFW